MNIERWFKQIERMKWKLWERRKNATNRDEQRYWSRILKEFYQYLEEESIRLRQKGLL